MGFVFWHSYGVSDMVCLGATDEAATTTASGYVFFRFQPRCYGVSSIAVVEILKSVSGAWLAVVLRVDGGVGSCEVSTMLELCKWMLKCGSSAVLR